jgi:ADP-ribose pyrophosphatase YjhB (NUDIX family)
MKQRIRAAALIKVKGKVLLVEHQDKRGNRWWVPPGGGLEDSDPSILDCVKREVREETGLEIQVGILRYVQEFIDKTNETRHLGLFFDAEVKNEYEVEFPEVAPTVSDAALLTVKWVGSTEIQNLSVFPEVLKREYWKSSSNNLTQYLGVSSESKDRKT